MVEEARSDRYAWIRNGLLGLVVVAWVFTLVVRAFDVAEDRHQSMAIYVQPAAGGDLVVTGNRTGDDQFDGLRLGDVILAVGDQTGLAGQLEFRHAFLNADGELRIERGGEERNVEVPLDRRGGGGMALATTVLLGVLGIMVAFAGRAAKGRRRPAAVMLFGGITTGATPNGWSPEILGVCIYLQAIPSALIGPFIVNWVQEFVRDDRPLIELAWPWLFAVMGLAVYSVYMGQPIAPPVGLWLTAAFPLLIATSFVAISMSAYPHIHKVKRTQLNWLIAGVAVYATASVSLFILSSILSEPMIFQVGQSHLWLIIAVSFAMSILKADFADVDRAVSTAVTYAFLVVMLALFIEFVAEPLAGIAASSLGLSEAAGQTLMIVLFALGAPELKKRFEPRIKAYFSREAD